ncbi:uncharacterized protein LOC144864336 [Branchiostoma floridae x Branchiostoma japonicum]
MKVLCAIFLGSTLLLAVSSAAAVAENADVSLLQLLKDVTAHSSTQQGASNEAENILDDLREIAEENESDDGATVTQGCKGHQDGDGWGTPEHENCFCDGQASSCYRAECPPGSDVVRDSDGLWVCTDGGSTEEENGIDLEETEDAAEARLVAEEERGLARDITVPKSWDDVIEQIHQLKTEMTKKYVPTGSYIERCESGVLTTPYASLLHGSGERHRDLTATFSKPFRRTPTVTIGFGALDTYKGTNLRITSRVTGCWPSHFTVRIGTWWITKVYTASVHWMACA